MRIYVSKSMFTDVNENQAHQYSIILLKQSRIEVNVTEDKYVCRLLIKTKPIDI